ncbi:MAG: hypothetical protein WDO14_24290 [Bacteroidota bacterium]
MDTFYIRGEFFLYSLSLVVSSYLVFNQFKAKPWDLYSTFSKVSLLLLVTCAGFYAILSTTQTPNLQIIEFFFILLIALTIPLFYYSQVVSNKNTPDVAEVRRTEQDNIADSLQ